MNPRSETVDPAPCVVLVTGSMRSGTSSLAGSLKLLGFHVPQPEVPASPRNPKGHFEPHWVIRFHKRLLRRALVRPSDSSPQALGRVRAVLGDGSMATELARWLAGQSEPRLVVKDPHAAWLIDTWREVAGTRGLDLRLLTAIRHPAEVVGSQDLTWGHRRTEEQRRLKETSNVAAWLNGALVTERQGRDTRRSFIRYADLIADWRSALGRASEQLDLGLGLDPERTGHPLDEWLDPSMRRSQLTWDDLVVPPWLRGLAQDAWDQLNALVEDPVHAAATARLDEIREEYDARYAEAVAVSLDEARHRERRGARNGAAKMRPRLQEARRRLARLQVDSRPASALSAGRVRGWAGALRGVRSRR